MAAECITLDWSEILSDAISRGASDVHVAVGQRVFFRLAGQMFPYGEMPADADFVHRSLSLMMGNMGADRFQAERELDFSWDMQGQRFRVNAYYQGGKPALALRIVPRHIPTLEEIGAPAALQKLLTARQGLILVTGSTGTGKTTTLASFLAAINSERAAHIVTLEDPVEFVLSPQRAFISQRELGRDFTDFAIALRGVVRAMPDVLLIGELRDTATMRAALNAAEAGILVLGTLHTPAASEAPLRIESLFRAEEQAQIRAQLATVLAGVFAQRLLSRQAGGRVCATEILLPTPAVRHIIRQGKYEQLPSAILTGSRDGMQTFAMAVKNLYERGIISRDDMLRYQEP